MAIIYKYEQFCFGILAKKGERYQDKHLMQYEHNTHNNNCSKLKLQK